jgi:alkaline phosphatase D
LNPLFFLHLGDMHYLDIAVNDPEEFQIAYELVLSSPAQSTLYRSAPIAYMWDDHDYGPNNSNSTAAGRQAARQTYQGYVPHYPLPAGSGNVPIYQSFVIGRVRFILSDLRSERSPQSDPEGPAKTMMGATQKAWFKDELLAGRDAQKLIVWAGTVPWIGPAVANGDHWAGYTTERQELANFIGDNQVHNLVMLSGDAHMIALDGGSNSGYASGGGGGFPVMHAAALDRSGSTKGGPYSHGSYPGRGQFGTMDIYDDGGAEVSYLLRGYDAGLNQIVSYAKGNRVLLPLIRKD